MQDVIKIFFKKSHIYILNSKPINNYLGWFKSCLMILDVFWK